MFSVPPNKNYKKDIEILYEAIKSQQNFSFSKFCDGEWAVIKNQPINNREFWFDPNSEKDQNKRQKLLQSFTFNNDRYFIGVTCVNVFGLEIHKQMKQLSNREEKYITWADIFVNSNYGFYINNILPLYKERPVVLFCNENGKVENLPFTPYMIFRLKNNAWEYNWNLIEEIKLLIKHENIKNMIFLFCCGPFGNILCYELTKEEPGNTYLDIGSTLNPFLQSEQFKRHYYSGDGYFSKMIGAWET